MEPYGDALGGESDSVFGRGYVTGAGEGHADFLYAILLVLVVVVIYYIWTHQSTKKKAVKWSNVGKSSATTVPWSSMTTGDALRY